MVKFSYSGLKDYLNCPKQYYEVKVTNNYTKSVSKEMMFGSHVHKALEDYARDKIPLPSQYEIYRPTVDAILGIGGDVYLEQRMAVDTDMQPCAWTADSYWFRGIVDLMVVRDNEAFIIDYKTGSDKYADPKQLKLMALLTYAHHPQVETIKAGLLFLTRRSFVPEEYTRKTPLWDAFDQDVKRLESSYANNDWPTNPTGLCRYCPVKSCEHNR
jgi:CRISPR/Cas system-associated exonuclease Cas4 (RecB family)